MPSRKLTPGGSLPPSCKYLCTASRPVKSTPEINTSSPTFSARIFSSVEGLVSWIIKIKRGDGVVEQWSGEVAEYRSSGQLLARWRHTPTLHYFGTPFSIQPFHDFPTGVQRHALPAIRPALVADADETGGWQTIDRADSHAEQSRPATKAHRADAQFVGRFQNVLFQRLQFRDRVVIVQEPQKLALGKFVTRGAIAADADAEDAGAAAFSLRLEHGVEDHFAVAIQVAVCFQLLIRQRILCADVFAATAFQNQARVEFVRAALVKMERWRARTDIRAVVDAAERVHRVLAQVTEFGGLLHRHTGRVLKGDLVHAHRSVHVKQNAAGVLANRLRLLFGQRDVAID